MLVDKQLELYQKAVNKIDYYFEYKHESVIDSEVVKEILQQLTERLRAGK